MRNDRAFLIDMLEHACLIADRRKIIDRATFDNDPVLQMGMAHALQNIGEAARMVTETGRTQFPSLPWKQIVGSRMFWGTMSAQPKCWRFSVDLPNEWWHETGPPRRSGRLMRAGI